MKKFVFVLALWLVLMGCGGANMANDEGEENKKNFCDLWVDEIRIDQENSTCHFIILKRNPNKEKQSNFTNELFEEITYIVMCENDIIEEGNATIRFFDQRKMDFIVGSEKSTCQHIDMGIGVRLHKVSYIRFL